MYITNDHTQSETTSYTGSNISMDQQLSQFQFNGTKSESVPTPAGVPQRSPLSPLLYMYYNTDLLEVAP
jgi:hypothetical protein